MTLNDSCHKHACHDYEGVMSVLCTLLQVKCYRCGDINVIHLSFPSDFRDKLWVGIGLRIFFSDRNVVHVLLGKITVTLLYIVLFLPFVASYTSQRWCCLQSTEGFPKALPLFLSFHAGTGISFQI